MATPAEKLEKAAGGPTKLSQLLEVDRSWIWRWKQPKKRGGLDGQVPQKHHKKALELSEQFGWGITPADLIGWEPNRQTG